MLKSILFLSFLVSIPVRCSPCGSYPCILGSDYLGVGYDAVQGQSTGVPILQFTFDQKNFWFNPFQRNHSGVYSVADQILAVESYGMKTYSWSFEEAYSYSKFLATQSGLDISSILDSSGWFGVQVAEMQQKVESEDQTYSLTEQSISLYELTYLPSSQLISKSFIQDAMSLPEVYDFRIYLNFIQSYGTHVVVSATLGGKSSYKTFADSIYSSANTNFVLGGNARSDFYDAKGGVGGDYSHSQATSDFKQHGASNYERAGGDPTIDKNQWREWVDTLGDNPVAIKSQLRPIYDLINDTTRSLHLQQTIEKYSSNNSFSKQPKNKSYQLSGCSCYSISVPYACRLGDVMYGTMMDGDSPYQTTFCCSPCFSWQSEAFSNTLDSNTKRASYKVQPMKDALTSFVQRAEKRNKSKPSKCGNYECIPGLDTFGVMFDAVKGQSKHIPAIGFTFSLGKTWQNPWNSNLIYAVPDQVNLINNPEELQFYDLINSTETYQSYLSSQAGLDLSFMGFGLSDEVSSTTDTFLLNQNVLTILTNEFTFYKFALSFHWNISSDMQAALKGLATDYSSDKYTRFFQTYGTHYVASATYGGKSKMLTSVNQDYYLYRTEDEIEAKVGLMYDGFTFGFGENVTSQDGFSDFYSSSFSEFYLEGGNYLEYSANQQQEWKKSIVYAPSQLRYSLQPISSLISDSEMRQEFAVALNDYAQISLSSASSESSVLIPNNYQGVGQYRESCGNGWAGFYESYQGDTNHYMLPVNCSTFAWSPENDLVDPTQCNCQSVNNPACPPNTFVTAVTSYAGWNGNFPKLPLNCCGLCFSTIPE